MSALTDSAIWVYIVMPPPRGGMIEYRAEETDFVRESRQRERLQNRHPDNMADVN